MNRHLSELISKFSVQNILFTNKKIYSFLIKLLIGVISFWIIFKRLNEIPDLKEQSIYWFSEPKMYLVLVVVLFLMPINWGIESYKWKSITQQIERVPYSTALKSVFSGICIGNLAPGRAMEFLAKIYYFKAENRPSITVLHFINGMFQMLITVTVGIISIVSKLQKTESSYFIYAILICGLCMILFFCWAIFNVSFIQQKLKFIKWFRKFDTSHKIQFPGGLIFKLIALSIVRYFVFTTQFYLIYNALSPQTDIIPVFMSIAAYFMLTSLVPMISIIEPAIRAAIALFVFNNTGDNSVIVILSSTFVWIINVVVPSIIGYIIILREKFDFKFTNAN